MKSATKPQNEEERLALLHELDILDTLEEQAYDDLTKIASTICDTPISLVSLIDEERQWFKSHHGLDATETPREFAFCAHAILADEVFYVPDSDKDERFSDNPLVTDDPNVKFYAGVPLTLKGNIRVGTLCVIDSKPRELSPEQINALESLGRQVVSQLELRLKIKELERVDQMKTEFVAMVSHELRTPLTSIFGSLSLLKSGALESQPEKINKLIHTSFDNSERLIAIVNDILELTKLEAGTFELEPIEHNIKTTLLKVQEAIAPYCKRCNVKLVVESEDINFIYDENRMIQILNNLISNAAKFSPAESEIKVRASLNNGNLTIAVTDQGKGIPKEIRHSIFEKFSKVSAPGQAKLPGTGLGLNITRQLVELHDGRIWFESEIGQGTTFYLEFPKK